MSQKTNKTEDQQVTCWLARIFTIYEESYKSNKKVIQFSSNSKNDNIRFAKPHILAKEN